MWFPLPGWPVLSRCAGPTLAQRPHHATAVGYHYCPSDPAALLPADGVGSIGLVLCFKARQRELDPGTVLTMVKKGAGPSRRPVMLGGGLGLLSGRGHRVALLLPFSAPPSREGGWVGAGRPSQGLTPPGLPVRGRPQVLLDPLAAAGMGGGAGLMILAAAGGWGEVSSGTVGGPSPMGLGGGFSALLEREGDSKGQQGTGEGSGPGLR